MKKFLIAAASLAISLSAVIVSSPSHAFDASKLDQPAFALAAAHLSLYWRICKGPLSMNMRTGLTMLVDQMPDGLPDRAMKMTQKELAKNGKRCSAESKSRC